MNDHSQLFRLLALLLDYPRAELREESSALCADPHLRTAGSAARSASRRCSTSSARATAGRPGALRRSLRARPLGLALLFFEHVHGESRDRGRGDGRPARPLLRGRPADRRTGAAGPPAAVPNTCRCCRSRRPARARRSGAHPRPCWRCAWRNAAAPTRRFSRRCGILGGERRTSARCVATRPRNSATTAWRPSTGPGRKPR